MGRRQIHNRNTRTLLKGATSYMVTIPIEAIRELGWKRRQKLTVTVDYRNKEIVIRDWPSRPGGR